jgi:hypothetical protein
MRAPVAPAVIPLLVTALFATTPGGTAERPLSVGDDVIFSAARSAPRPGQLFFGAVLRFTRPPEIRIFSVTCTAHLGGRIVRPDHVGVAFAGGVKLRPVIRRTYTPPDVQGRRFLQRVACGWRIPLDAKGKLLSLLPRPNHVPCDTSCPPTGLDVQYGGPTDTYPTSFRTFNQTTWRVMAPPPP